MEKKIRYYFSFRSPYSWIASRWLEQLKINKHIIEYIPFWEPDNKSTALLESKNGKFLYTPMSKEKHIYILQDIKRITQKLGYKMTWPIDKDAWWDLPHLAYIAASEINCGSDFFWAVYNARWEEGKNVCKEVTIKEILLKLDIEPDLIIDAPYRKEIREKGAEALLKCYQDGAFGVPFFIYGFEKFWGIDRFRDFLHAISEGNLNETNKINNYSEMHEYGIQEENIFSYIYDHSGGCG